MCIFLGVLMQLPFIYYNYTLHYLSIILSFYSYLVYVFMAFFCKIVIFGILTFQNDYF